MDGDDEMQWDKENDGTNDESAVDLVEVKWQVERGQLFFIFCFFILSLKDFQGLSAIMCST